MDSRGLLLVVVSWQCHRAIIVFIVWHLEHNDSQWTAEVSYSNLDTALPHSQLSTVTIPEAHVRIHWSTTATKVCSILTTQRHVTTLNTLCREGLGTRLTKGLIGRPLLQTPTTGAMQGRPGDEANQRPHWKATTTHTNNWSHAGKAWGRG